MFSAAIITFFGNVLRQNKGNLLMISSKRELVFSDCASLDQHQQSGRDWNIVSISNSRGNLQEAENPWKFMKWHFWYNAQRTIIQVTAGNLSNSIPAWRFCRKKGAPVIRFFSSATIQPTSSQKRRPAREMKQGQWLPTRRHNVFKTSVLHSI